jgi:hypothetical protein
MCRLGVILPLASFVFFRANDWPVQNVATLAIGVVVVICQGEADLGFSEEKWRRLLLHLVKFALCFLVTLVINPLDPNSPLVVALDRPTYR